MGWDRRGWTGEEGREGGRRVPKVTPSKKILDPPLRTTALTLASG